MEATGRARVGQAQLCAVRQGRDWGSGSPHGPDGPDNRKDRMALGCKEVGERKGLEKQFGKTWERKGEVEQDPVHPAGLQRGTGGLGPGTIWVP